MHKIRKLIQILFLITILLASVSFLNAAEATAEIDFVASYPDSNNNITVTMTIRNATFNALQFVIRYDPQKLQPIDKDTKIETGNFNKFAQLNNTFSESFISFNNKLNIQLGMFEFTNYLNPNSSFAYDSPIKENLASIGQSGLEVYTFYFNVKNKDGVYIEIAKIDGSKPYNDTFEDGWALAYGSYRVSGSVSFDLSKLNEFNVTEEFTNPTPESILPVKDQNQPEISETPIIERPTTALERLQDTLVLQIGNYAAAKDGALCHIYPGEKVVTPYIKNQRTFVPIRFIAEKLGMEVSWDDTNRTVRFIKGMDELTLKIGDKGYKKNGVFYEIDTAAELQWNRTMVPIRFVAEALGYAVEWNTQLNMVYITKSELPWLLDETVEKQATSDVALVISPLLRDFV